jgi:predicted enzyme related to lactoylglutathione lyase
MQVFDKVLRLYAESETFEDVIAFYERVQNVACGLRFEIAENGIKGAKIGGVLVLSADKEVLEPFREVQAIFYVDSIDEFVPWLVKNGATILHGPQTVGFGRNMTVRNPDGLVVEYFEPKAQS